MSTSSSLAWVTKSQFIFVVHVSWNGGGFWFLQLALFQVSIGCIAYGTWLFFQYVKYTSVKFSVIRIGILIQIVASFGSTLFSYKFALRACLLLMELSGFS